MAETKVDETTAMEQVTCAYCGAKGMIEKGKEFTRCPNCKKATEHFRKMALRKQGRKEVKEQLREIIHATKTDKAEVKENEDLALQLEQTKIQLRKANKKVEQLKKVVGEKNTTIRGVKTLLKEMSNHLTTIIELA